MVLELPEAGFDIVCMDGNIPVGECDSEIPQVGEEVSHDCAKGAIELCAIFGEGHEVDGNGVRGGVFGRVENEWVLLSLFDKVGLWGEEYVWHEPGNPSRERDAKIVLFLFVHGFHDCIKFLHDGWVVAVLPVGHEVFPRAFCIENVRAPSCHGMLVVLQQFVVHVWQDVPKNIINIPCTAV